jgi:hypothetical protein
LRERVQLGDGFLLEFGDIHWLEPRAGQEGVSP